MKNEFSDETRSLFIFNYQCFSCRYTKPLELHHIFGRRREGSDSPLNASPICRDCHEKGGIHRRENREKLLNKTLKYLERQNYKLTEKDLSFLEQTNEKTL